MAPPKPGQPALIPENVLKRKNDLDELARKRAANEELRPKKKAKSAALSVIKPETILAKARNRRNHGRRVKRVEKKGMQKRASNKPEFAEKQVDADEETAAVRYQSNSVGAKMVFCIRIRNNDCIPKEALRILQKFRLQNLHDGVFLPYTEANRKALHVVEPWVVYGPPKASAVKDLIERRGHCKVKGERIPLSDNIIIEETLGEDHNILCVEDLVHSLTTVDESFPVVQKFLWPFRLADSKSRYERNILKAKDGTEYGDRGEAIHEYIQLVL